MPNEITSSARLSTPGGINYTLMQGYPRGDVDGEGGATAEEVYLIAATDLDDFIAEVTPAPQQIGNRIIWTPRYRMPGTTFLVLKSLSFEPHNTDRPMDPFNTDPDAPAETYEKICKVSLKYETNIESDEDSDRDDQSPETFLEHSFTSSVEMLAIQPNNKTETIDDTDGQGVAAAPKNPQYPIVKVIPLQEHNLSWKRALNPNFPVIFGMLGKLNDAALEFLLDAPAETVMFMGLAGKREFQYLGRRISIKPWSLDFKFAQRQITERSNTYGWNHVYNPDKHAFERLKRTLASGAKVDLYETDDFLQLFQPLPQEDDD